MSCESLGGAEEGPGQRGFRKICTWNQGTTYLCAENSSSQDKFSYAGATVGVMYLGHTGWSNRVTNLKQMKQLSHPVELRDYSL